MKKKVLIFLLVLCLIFTLVGLTGCEKSEGINDEWKNDVLESYNEFIKEVNASDSCIPMIVTTDQHGHKG